LDAYPKTYEQCMMLFMEEVQETGEDNEVKITRKLNQRLVPETVAVLDCSDDDIMKRFNNLDPETCKKLE